MKHRVFAPAVGLLAVAFAIAGMATQARAADPSGIWAKDDGSAKLEVKKCGRGICSKIVWLRNPNDSRGRPLRDARNENPSMRDRPIMGLQLFSNMVLTAPNTWVGNVYNPEEGRVYTDVKVTMVSRQQIVLRGCRTWLLCGEKSWTKSRLPAEQEPIEVKAPAAPEAPPEPPATREETIEANATPEPKASVAEAARKTTPEMAEASASLERAVPATVAEPRVSEAPKMKITKAAPSYQHTAIGFGFGLAATNQEPMPLSGDNVSSMMVMTRPSPLAPEAAPQPHAATPVPVETALQEDDPVPAPVARPKPKPRAQAVQALAAPVTAAKPKPKPRPAAREPQERLPWLQ